VEPNADTLTALTTLRRLIPRAAEELRLDVGPGLQPWCEAVDRKLLPRMAPEFPLVAAVCGGGSAGKSTLFNSLVGHPVSPTGGRAGLNRRVLVALNSDHLHAAGFMTALGHAFKGALKPMQSADELLTPGDPLYWSASRASGKVVLLDTPDIDTGAGGQYTNRELARQSLEAADVLIYIFTNATYNNRDNTEFMARLLNAVGTRPCFLVYRVYTSFTDEEVAEHSRTVARNLYGPGFEKCLLGMFRADEENAVAAGETPVQLRAVEADGADLTAALIRIDARALRRQVLESVYKESVRQAEALIDRVTVARDELEGYLELFARAQGGCVQTALSRFPTDRVLRRFAEIWLAGDPVHIKIMRGTGHIVEWPYRMIFKAVRRRTSDAPGRPKEESNAQLAAGFEIDLLAAANQLYQTVLDEEVHFDDRSVAAPPVVRDAQLALRQKDWQRVLTHILAQKEALLSWSNQLESELRVLVDDLRSRMRWHDQVRQTFAALLNVIPATAAVTYILHTGDPVGAVGIKVKLTGLFGLKDLYALIAIPATSGMKKADRRQLEQMLAPVARTWLEHKLRAVQTLFEEQISGGLLSRARAARDQAATLTTTLEQALAVCKEAVR
jgi:50S ribosome-binding GTPase